MKTTITFPHENDDMSLKACFDVTRAELVEPITGGPRCAKTAAIRNPPLTFAPNHESGTTPTILPTQHYLWTRC